jgi:hypothetical protein
MAFLRLKKKAIINNTNSSIANGKNNAGGTKVPAIVPTKAMASDKANVLSTEGKNSVDVCVYNFSSPLVYFIYRIYEEKVKMFHFIWKNLFLLSINLVFQQAALLSCQFEPPL